jgi:hypothetical protein
MENSTQLTISDMDTLRAVIDLACSRGAFRANEMQRIGELFNKLNAFVEAVAAQAQAQEAQQDADTTASETPQGEAQ